MQLNNKVARRRSLEIGIENVFVYIEERVVDDAKNRFICCSSQRIKKNIYMRVMRSCGLETITHHRKRVSVLTIDHMNNQLIKHFDMLPHRFRLALIK